VTGTALLSVSVLLLVARGAPDVVIAAVGALAGFVYAAPDDARGRPPRRPTRRVPSSAAAVCLFHVAQQPPLVVLLGGHP
jgi:hypothetical protein